MRKLLLFVCVSLMAAIIVSARQTRSTPAGITLAEAAKICAEPAGDWADGWPEGPVYFLYHREKSKAPWARNPATQAPGLESSTLAGARTLVCVEQTLEKKGQYDSGESGYMPRWSVNLVRLADRRAFLLPTSPEFEGDHPPSEKYTPGPGIGQAPVQPMIRWLHLLLDQKVARLKMHFDQPAEKSYGDMVLFDGISDLAVSRDGTRLAVAWIARERSLLSARQDTPPSPMIVFDLASKKAVATFHLDYSPGRVAISKSGNLIAIQHYRNDVEIWDVASGKIVHKLAAPAADSLFFAPDDTLATAGGGQVAVWDIGGERKIRSATGTRIMLSPAGVWMIVRKDSAGTTVQEMESGRSVATFPKVNNGETFAISEDGAVMTTADPLGFGAAKKFSTGSAQGQTLTLPSLKMDVKAGEGVRAIAATRDGVIFSGGQFVGIVSTAHPEPRYFVSAEGYTQTMAVSPDGKLIVLGDKFGHGSVWELY